MAGYDDAKVMSGHRAAIKVDGQTIGWAQGITWQSDHGVQDAVVLGSYTVAEHQGTVYRVNGSIQRFRIRADAASVLSKRSAAAVSSMALFDLEVQDDTGEYLAYLKDVTIAGKNGGIQAGQLCTEATSFKAIDLKEADVEGGQ